MMGTESLFIDKNGEKTELETELPVEDDEEIPKAEQSANTLFHFVKQYDHLTDTLKSSYLYPRYCREKYQYLSEEFPELIFPMKCFCDIYLEKLYLHCRDYGEYGIGFDRDALIKKGVQPVQYINKVSDLGLDLQKEIKEYIKSAHDLNSEVNSIDFYNSRLFCRLKYSKEFTAKEMETITGEKHDKFLPDEKEWRFIPKISKYSSIKPFLDPSVIIRAPTLIKKRSDKIKRHYQLGIHYEYNEIKYIIIPHVSERRKLIRYIDKYLKISKIQKLELISKIIVLNDVEEDL